MLLRGNKRLLRRAAVPEHDAVHLLIPDPYVEQIPNWSRFQRKDGWKRGVGSDHVDQGSGQGTQTDPQGERSPGHCTGNSLSVRGKPIEKFPFQTPFPTDDN